MSTICCKGFDTMKYIGSVCAMFTNQELEPLSTQTLWIDQPFK